MSIEAWDIVAKKKVTMVPDTIEAFKYKTEKGGYQYRLAGRSKDGSKLGLFVKKEVAERYGPVKLTIPKGKKRKSCKKIGEDAEKACEARRGAKKSAAAAKRAAARKKKATKKKPKVPTARKPRRKKK